MKKIWITMLGLSLVSTAFAKEVTPLSQIKEAALEEKKVDDEYIAIETLPIFLNAENTEGKGDGRIFPFAEAEVLEIKDGKMKLEIEGWKPENVPHVIYAEKGKRIMKALIGKDKAENIQISETEVEETTGQTWQKVSLIVWADMAGFVSDDKDDLLNQYGQELLTKSCASCHAVTAHHHSANQWPSVMKSMKRFVSLDDNDWAFLQYFVQYNAKDMVDSDKH